MSDVLVDQGHGILAHRTVSRINPGRLPVTEFPERIEIVTHVPVGREDGGRSLPEDRVAREEVSVLREVADVLCRVTRGSDGLECSITDAKDLAGLDPVPDVGFVEHPDGSVDRRAGAGAERGDGSGMVRVAVGHENRLEPWCRLENGVEMVGEIGSRIEDRDVIEQVRTRPIESVGTRVVRDEGSNLQRSSGSTIRLRPSSTTRTGCVRTISMPRREATSVEAPGASAIASRFLIVGKTIEKDPSS